MNDKIIKLVFLCLGCVLVVGVLILIHSEPPLRQSEFHPGLMADDTGLEPSTIKMGWATFTVHYLSVLENTDTTTPDWFAITMVVYDDKNRVYPAEIYSIPDDQQPPSIDGSGNTHLEAYNNLKDKLTNLTVGPKPEDSLTTASSAQPEIGISDKQ